MTPVRTAGALGTSVRRRRQRAALAIALGAAGGALLLFSLGAAYLVGAAERASEVARLEADLEAARGTVREATARMAAAEERAARLERAQRPAAPTRSEPPRELDSLLPLLAARLREGVPRERLARAIAALPAQPVCDAEIELRTLAVAVTPTRDGGGRGFAGGRFALLARGVAAKSPTGRTETWFDPAQPVQLVIRQAGQEPRLASGVLPLVEALVLERREYRFTARPTERRGTIEVSLQVCDYP
jgi:hypothetical protein